jgi:hypothetical protein
MQTLLTPEDSKRVADALISHIRLINIEDVIYKVLDRSLNNGPFDKLGNRIASEIGKAIKDSAKK